MYTKGEWKIHKPVNCDYTIHAGEWGKGITKVAVVAEGYPNAGANANLIAQSPRMYELLEEITTTELNAETLYILQPWLNKVLAILEDAKAGGGK